MSNDELERIYKEANGGSDKLSTAAIFRAMNAAIEAEREACAKVCDEMFSGQFGAVHVASTRCADAIRKRANAPIQVRR